MKTKNPKKTHIYLVNIFNLHPKTDWEDNSLYNFNNIEMALLRDDTRCFNNTALSLNNLAKTTNISIIYDREPRKVFGWKTNTTNEITDRLNETKNGEWGIPTLHDFLIVRRIVILISIHGISKNINQNVIQSSNICWYVATIDVA